jgi:hypothetical protein
MPSSALVLFLIGFILVAPIVSAQPRPMPKGDTPLDRHREMAVSRPNPALVIEGWVAAVQRGTIVTSVSPQDLLTHDFDDGDSVSLEIGGKLLAARIVSMPTYLAVAGDPKAADTLDFDILGVIDDRGLGKARLALLGLGGNLAEWLRARPGMSVTLRKPR